MKIEKPSFEIIDQQPGIFGMYKQIELAGRTCYKSADKITDISAKDFVERMIKNGHLSVLEHGTVYLRIPFYNKMIFDMFNGNPHSIVRVLDRETTMFVTTNYRVIAENELGHLLQFMCDYPSGLHERRVTVRFNTQIAISREFNRHRVNSISEQSTRYVNYSKEKFGNEISINLPSKIDAGAIDENIPQHSVTRYIKSLANEEGELWTGIDWWLFANLICERAYMELIKRGWKPQEARTILPLDTSTELVHTAFITDWKHFFDLRADGKYGTPHPDAHCLASELKNEFIKQNFIC
jgi:thymidylate synthase (FAD)